MDGSVSTLAPVFAAAFATHSTWNTFLVGLAATIGAGISMGFAEALADDGKLSGRGTPYLRGLICGLMTMAGGIGHTLPFLIHDFWTATGASIVATGLELAAIAWVQWKIHGHGAAIGDGEGDAGRGGGVGGGGADRERVTIGVSCPAPCFGSRSAGRACIVEQAR